MRPLILLLPALLLTACQPAIDSFQDCVDAGNPVMESHPRRCIAGNTTYTETVGGQRDEHGCLTPAGYSWNETIGACARSWELDHDEARAASTAAEPFDATTTITDVQPRDCQGCYTVTLERNDNQRRHTIIVQDWQAQNITQDRNAHK